MSGPNDSFFVTPSRVTFALGLIALLGIVWQAVSYIEAQSYRLATVEQYVIDDKETTARMVEQIDRLTHAVTRLTVVIDRLPDERQEPRQ